MAPVWIGGVGISLIDHWRLAAVAAVVLRRRDPAARSGWAGPAQGRWLLNFVFYVALPILIFGALTGATLAREHAVLPAIAGLHRTRGLGSCRVPGAPVSACRRRGEGAMSLCAMSMNIAMIYPFASLSLGTAAFSQLVMFDMGHAGDGVDAHHRRRLQVRRSHRRHSGAAAACAGGPAAMDPVSGARA